MKSVYIITFSIIVSFVCINFNPQTNLINKKYTAYIGSGCKEYNDGRCSMSYFTDLEFEKDSVLVTFRTKFYITRTHENSEKETKEIKKYKWYIRKKIITIKNFNDYGELKIVDKKIIGRLKINDNEFKKIEFNEQK